MFSKLPPLAQEIVMMGAGAGLAVLESNPTSFQDLTSAKHITVMAVGAVLGAVVHGLNIAVKNWLTTGNATINTTTTMPAETPTAKKLPS